MLEKLFTNHKTWLAYAKSITKDIDDANDLVSEMYLKLHNSKKEVNKAYVYRVLQNIYIDNKKTRDREKEANLNFIRFNFDVPINNVSLPDTLTWVEKQVVLIRQEKSLREMEATYHIGYATIRRIELKAIKKLQEWVQKLQASEI